MSVNVSRSVLLAPPVTRRMIPFDFALFSSFFLSHLVRGTIVVFGCLVLSDLVRFFLLAVFFRILTRQL